MEDLRTNIVISKALMDEALQYSGLKTKRAVVDEALRLLVRIRKQEAFRQLYGKVEWEGNLGEMRASRPLTNDWDTDDSGSPDADTVVD